MTSNCLPEKDTKVLQETFKTFPNLDKNDLGEFVCLVSGEVEEISDWKNAVETGVKTILATLENENKRWREERQRNLDSGYTNSAGIYEEILSFNKGRIFSLKQILGEL